MYRVFLSIFIFLSITTVTSVCIAKKDIMAVIKKKTITNWGYQLQGMNVDKISTSNFNLMVIDFSRDGSGKKAFTKDEVAKMKKNRLMISYISIGEASDYRDHWRDNWTTYTNRDKRAAGKVTANAPAWLGAWNRDWPNSRKVRYWQAGWKTVVYKWIDSIIDAGFNGIYMDIVDAYYHWGVEVPSSKKRSTDPKTEKEAAQRMIDFVAEISQYARKKSPGFIVIPQNAPFIMDALAGEDEKRKRLYLASIDAIACESIYYCGGEPINNNYAPDKEVLKVLKRDFIDNGKPVLAVDYITGNARITKFYNQASILGAIPYVAPSRELDVLGIPYIKK